MNKKNNLRFRQIHLDFHTSPLIPDIGSQFHADEFAATLKKAHVDSVTCFARCHHGMLYYNSKKFPERIHPHLQNRDMLKQMVEACHKQGIRVPIYITIQWDQYTAEEHPEWIAIDENGKQVGTGPYEAGFYRVLCVNTEYRDFLKAQIQELFEELDVDGIFMDIVYPTDCSCKVCRQKMKAEGINIRNKQERLAYSQRMLDEFKRDISAWIRSFKEDASIFYNTSHIGVRQRPVLDTYSHLELESLPSGNWGYIHFPVTMRYARTLGLECLAHTGKFHLEWGDFHSFKNLPALEYECFRMLALGSKCLIGDQMEPCGKLSEPVYDLIGKVYSRVEEVEPWCQEITPRVDFAVMTPEEFEGGGRASLPESLMGAENMFDKSAWQFDIIDSKSDFDRYPLLILPDTIPVKGALKEKIHEYLNRGGKVLATFESGIDFEEQKADLEEYGIRVLAQTRDEDGVPARGRIDVNNSYIDYILPNETVGKNLPRTEHVMYAKGVEIAAEEGTEVLADFVKPYFDRTYEHFCSHRQTPSSGKKGNPAIVRKGNVIYIASPVFRIFQARAPKWCRSIVDDCIRMLIGKPLIEHTGPSTVFASLNRQEGKNRDILHILHYIPEKYCNEIHTVEDVIPLYNLRIQVKMDQQVEKVRLVPSETSLNFEQKEEYIEFNIPEINGYQVVEIAYKNC